MNSDFEQFFDAVRRRDRQAANELARRLEPYLRRVIHLRLTNRKLRQVFDSMDICQSILGVFFAKADSHWLQIKTEQELQHLLVTMAFNRLRSRARHEQRRLASIPAGWDPEDRAGDPSEAVSDHDLSLALRRRLTAEELWLFEQNQVQGRTWSEIAQDLGDRPANLRNAGQDGLRLRLTRGLARVQRELRERGDDHVLPGGRPPRP
jgi:hypothetical protein